MNELNEYLALVEKRNAEREALAVTNPENLIALPVPSGATWLHLPFTLAQYAVGGRLPLHLAERLKAVRDAGGSEAEALSEDEMTEIGVNSLLIVRDVMLNKLIFPKIRLEPGADSILPEQIDPEDFDFFKEYVMGGGQAAQNSFRQQPNRETRRAAAARSSRKGARRSTVKNGGNS